MTSGSQTYSCWDEMTVMCRKKQLLYTLYFLDLHAQLLGWGGTVQGCSVPPQLSTLDVEVPMGRNSRPAALGAQSGEQHCCPALICPKCCQLPCWRVLSCASELSQISYARGELGLNLVLLRVVIPEALSPCKVKAVSQPDCSLSCPSGCSLLRSRHSEILLPVQQQGKCFSYVSSPLPSLPRLC